MSVAFPDRLRASRDDVFAESVPFVFAYSWCEERSLMLF